MDQTETIPLPGIPSLITLTAPFLYKDGKEYRHIQGPTWTMLADNGNYFCIGTYTDKGTHVTLPASSVLAVVECSKVLKTDNILILT